MNESPDLEPKSSVGSDVSTNKVDTVFEWDVQPERVEAIRALVDKGNLKFK